MPTTTALYGGLLGLLLVALSALVIRARGRDATLLGDGGHGALRRAIRVQGNFAEYVPITLLLMALAELQGSAGILLNAVAAALLAGRLLHAFGLRREPEILAFRVAGLVLTFGALIGANLLNLRLALA